MSKFAVVLTSAILWSGALQAEPPREPRNGPPDPEVMFDRLDRNEDGTVDHAEVTKFFERRFAFENKRRAERLRHEIERMKGDIERMEDELRQHSDNVLRDVERTKGEIARKEEQLLRIEDQ